MDINWHEIPFIRILIPFILGIITAIYWGALAESQPILLPILFTFLLIFHFGKRFILRPFFGITLFLFLFCLGNFVTTLNQEISARDHYSKYIAGHNFIEGKVINEPTHGKNTKCEIELRKIGTNIDSLFNCTGKTIIYFKNDIKTSSLKYGELIVAKIKLNPIPSQKNPFAFNYKNYLKYKNIDYQGFLQQDKWDFLNINEGNLIFKYAIQSRNHFNVILNKYVNSENENAVAKALILGNKTDLTDDIKNDYSGTGAIHVLAVSGLHVGIVMLILNLFFKLINAKSKSANLLKSILTLIGIWSFALITGAAPSVLRASTMLSLVIIGNIINRKGSIFNTIATAAFIMLAWNPYQIVDVGFQLSFLALVGIIYFQPIVYKLWLIENRFFNYTWELSSVAIAAQITTIPISFYYFHQFPVYFILSGIVVIPFAFVILSLGIALFVSSLFNPLATVIGFLLKTAVFAMNSIIHSILLLPGSLIKGIWIGLGSVLLLYLIISIYVFANESKKAKWMMYATVLSLFFSINHSTQTLHSTANSKIQLYHSSKNSIIDVFNGSQLTSLFNQKAAISDIDFATQLNRYANRIRKDDAVNFDNELVNNPQIFYQKGFLNFKGKTIFIPFKKMNINILSPIPVDYLLIRNDCSIPPKELYEKINPKEVILDASNNQWTVNKWKTYLKENEIPYYSIIKNGAMTIYVE